MGTRIEINGFTFPVLEYTVTEDSTPLAAGDTTGGTGTLDVTIQAPDPDLTYTQATGMKWVLDSGKNVLIDKDVAFTDSRYGTLPGRVIAVSSPNPASIRIRANTDLNLLNVYNVQAQPFVGTLGDLLTYYVSLSGSALPMDVDAVISPVYVEVPGWNGELWYHLKMLAVAYQFEIAIVSGVIVFRRIRTLDLPRGLETGASLDAGVPTLAQSVEVYRYKARAITNELVYPPGGWNPNVAVLNVNAGEESEYTLELSASVSSIQTPVMQTWVDQVYRSSSVFTIVANDGLPVEPAMWTDFGGLLEVTINPDTTSLKVRLVGAVGIPLESGEPATLFSVALGADTTGNRYSTLRIVGTGVAYDRTLRTFRTGLTPQQTGTAVGVTIDNPFLSTQSQICVAGTRAAAEYSGPIPGFSGSSAPRNTVLGQYAGSRVRGDKRPYRVRSVSTGPADISYSAVDDLVHDDVQGRYEGMTYGEVQALRDGLTYRDDYLTARTK